MAIAIFTAPQNQAANLRQFGHSPDEIAASFATLAEFGADHADAARQLIDQLNMA